MSVRVLSLEELAQLSSYLGEHNGHGAEVADRAIADLAGANSATWAARYEEPSGYVPSARAIRARRQHLRAPVSDLDALELLRKLNDGVWHDIATRAQAAELLTAFGVWIARCRARSTPALLRLAERRRVLGDRALEPSNRARLLRRFHVLTAPLAPWQPGDRPREPRSSRPPSLERARAAVATAPPARLR